ncbi:hypothetical protein CB1_000775013 [Camelus ferus]|nr:hypothetical protein CB1_000775013 [Camelus ferus]
MPSSLLGSAMPASTPASALQAALQEALENAGRLIDRQLQEDRMYPDLSELLMVSAPNPIVQIAIDNSRNILYTRSEKGVIQVYDLGHDGQGMNRVASVSQNSIVSAAGNIARTIDRSVFKPIVQIAVIENSESLDCQLLAVTHAGVRLYFSTCPFRQPLARPNTLTLVHIRLPPGFSASSTVEKPSKVHKALYSKGILLMAASENEDNDILWCVNHDTFPFQKPMMETQGSLMFHKLRPVDQLRHLLVSNVGGDGEEIERFFKLHQEFQEQLKITTFKDLVIRDKELTGALIASLINCYIRDNAAVDGISLHLQDICPLLYSTDDAVCSKANELLQRSRQVQNKIEKERMLRESLKEYQKISNQVDLSNVCAQYRQVRFYEGVVELSLTAAEKKDPQGLGLHFYKHGEPEEDIVGLQAFQERLNSYKCITDTLQELIASPFLEPHLVRMAKVDQNKVRYMDLLWRYYEKNRSFSNAARVLSKLADMHSTEISLQQRLEYIARAILSAKSSTAISSIAADGEFLHELEEKMELYGEFADPFKLAECKLAIIHCAGYSDPILVQTLWQDIIEKELNESVTLSSPDRMHALSLKIVLLGKIYAGTPRFFPLDFIVQFLEQQVCTLNWDVGFVIQTMNEIGVPLPRLLEVYDQLFKSRDPFWNRMKKPLHLLDCIHVLLTRYVENPSQVLNCERRRFTNLCLDAVCGYLVELQSMSSSVAVQTITGNFKSLQAKLERLH